MSPQSSNDCSLVQTCDTRCPPINAAEDHKQLGSFSKDPSVKSPTQVSDLYKGVSDDNQTYGNESEYESEEEHHYMDEVLDARAVEKMRTLQLRYWTRTEECKERKWDHMDYIDDNFESREKYILETTFKHSAIVLEPNMFPYDTPDDILHFTLWNLKDMNMDEIEDYIYEWILSESPFRVIEWNYDENEGERSINLFHIHVYFRVSSPKNEALKQYYSWLVQNSSSSKNDGNGSVVSEPSAVDTSAVSTAHAPDEEIDRPCKRVRVSEDC